MLIFMIAYVPVFVDILMSSAVDAPNFTNALFLINDG